MPVTEPGQDAELTFPREMSMSRTVLCCLALLAAGPTAAQTPAPSAQPPLRIAFINSREILQKTPGYTAAESTFSRELQGFRDEVQRLQQSQ